MIMLRAFTIVLVACTFAVLGLRDEQMPTTEPKDPDIDSVYHKFSKGWVPPRLSDAQKGEDLQRQAVHEVVSEWNSLCQMLNSANASDCTSRLFKWTPKDTRDKSFLHSRDSLLPRRMKWPVYKNGENLAGTGVLVVGAGPAGLRLAIEARLNGAEVSLLEGREYFSRMNVLKIYTISELDLRSLGMKNMWSNFVSNTGKQTVPIALLQAGLLRVALVLGVHVHPDCVYRSLVNASETSWKAKATCRGVDTPEQKVERMFDFDVIADATGSNGIVRSQLLPGQGDRKIVETHHAGTENYAITANFKRFPDDRLESDISKSPTTHSEDFKNKTLQLDNMIYFESPVAHYIVASVKEKSLGRLTKNESLPFSYDNNFDHTKLKDVVLELAREWNVPRNKGFYEEGPTRHGGYRHSFGLFGFGKMAKADRSFSILPPPPGGGREQVIVLVGDALRSPFWPDGTGCNSALLHAVHAVWNLIEWARGSKDYEQHAKKLFDIAEMAILQNCKQKCEWELWLKSGYDGSSKSPCSTKCSSNKTPFGLLST